MRFLIDECLSVELVTVAGEAGHEAHHVAHVGRAGWKDWNVLHYARERDFVLVTNNAADFRKLYATEPLHAGLVILIPNVDGEMQKRLFQGALEQLAIYGEPINQVLEVDIEGDEATAWDAGSIETIREATETVDELCRFYFKRAVWTVMDSGLDMESEMEELQWQDQLTDPSASVPLLSKIGESDAYIQMHNPGCILTSGLQRVASAPFFRGARGVARLPSRGSELIRRYRRAVHSGCYAVRRINAP